MRLPSIHISFSPSSHRSAQLRNLPRETQDFASLLLPITSLLQLSLFIIPIAPARSDAKSCVSRPPISLSVPHPIALPDCAHSLVRRKILRLPSIRAAISPSSHSSAQLRTFPRETQNFASLLLPTTSLSLLSLFILPIPPASRDARFCVSRPAISLSVPHPIALPDCAHSLVRRKILRLYLGWHHNMTWAGE